MSITIYPAVDLRHGRCVRLLQGQFDQETVYADDPLEAALRWQREGASWLHLVDLDGARAGQPMQTDVIRRICEHTTVRTQVGGGIRDLDAVRRVLDCGVTRVVIGSAAIHNPAFAESAFMRYPEQVALGIDARNGRVAIDGWEHTTETDALELAQCMAQRGAKVLIYTDIARDGMMSGIDVSVYKQLATLTGMEIIASGGIASLDDIRRLNQANISGCIVGKAFYEGRIAMSDCLNL